MKEKTVEKEKTTVENETVSESVTEPETVAEALPQPQTVEGIPIPEAPKKKNKAKIIIPIVLIAVLAIAAVLFFLFKPTSDSAKDYEKDLIFMSDETLFVANRNNSYKPDNVADIDIDVDEEYWSDYFAAMAVTSSTEIRDKYIYYIGKLSEDDESIYEKTFYRKGTAKEDVPEKIDSGVESFTVSDDEKKIIYEKDGDIFLNDTKQKTRLAKDVLIWCLSEDFSKILYTTADSKKHEGVVLYIVDISKKTLEPKKISADVVGILDISSDFSEIVFMKDENIYSYTEKEGNKKVLSDVAQIYDVEDSDKFYFTRKDKEGLEKSTYFADDMASQDKNMKKPVESDYYYYVYGYKFTHSTYYDALTNYTRKENRDKVRDDAKENIETYALYYFDGENEKLVSKDVGEIIDYSEERIIFKEYDAKSAKKFKMSELEYINDYYDELETAREATVKTQFAVGTTIKEVDLKDATGFAITSDNSVYFVKNNKDKEGKIKSKDYCKMIVGEDGKEIISTIAEDIDSYRWFDGKLAYFKDVNDKDCGDLYFNEKLICSDVYTNYIQYSNGKFYLYTDYDEDEAEGTLKVGTAEAFETICDEASGEFTITDEGYVLYTTSSDELNMYKEEESILIGEDVTYYTYYSRVPTDFQYSMLTQHQNPEYEPPVEDVDEI